MNDAGPLLQHLPAIYHSSESETLRGLLAAFETVLFGSDGSAGPEIEGLETKIAKVPTLFAPCGPSDQRPDDRTPPEFLPWLAQWVALAHGRGLPEDRLRNLIARSVPLYAQRGTKAYIEELLKLFLTGVESVSVNDQETTAVVVGRSRVGVDSWLGGDRPFWFRVVICVDSEESNEPGPGLERSARSVIELAKPAYTTYELEWRLGSLAGDPPHAFRVTYTTYELEWRSGGPSEGDRLGREDVFGLLNLG